MNYDNPDNSTEKERSADSDHIERKISGYSIYRPVGYPVRHKRKVPFGPSIRLDQDYRNIFNSIMEMDHRLNEIVLTAGDYLDFVNDVCSSNIHWSTSIEGNPLTHDAVKKISTSYFRGDVNVEKRDGPTQEILNHLHSYVTANRFDTPWGMDVLRDTHRLLTSGTGISGEPGDLRTHESVIRDENDFEYMIPCPCKNIEEELISLLFWLEGSPYDPLVTATLFFHEFESIHPFTDGNGRTGRTLFQILIQELGLKNFRLCRFEEEILGSLQTYYDLLGYADQSSDYVPLIRYMAESINAAYGKALSEFGSKNVLKGLDDASKTIVVRSKKTSWFTISDASSWISLGEQRTAQKLNGLVKMDVLEKDGRTQSTRFRFKDPLIHLMSEGDSGRT